MMESRVLHGPFIPSGTHKSLQTSSQVQLPDLCRALHACISLDWKDVTDISVLATQEDDIVIKFDLMSVPSVLGVESYMNCLLKKNGLNHNSNNYNNYNNYNNINNYNYNNNYTNNYHTNNNNSIFITIYSIYIHYTYKDIISENRLRKVVEEWGSRPGDGYLYFMLRPVWVHTRVCEPYYVLHPEKRMFNTTKTK